MEQETQIRIIPCEQISTHQGDLRLQEPGHAKLIRNMATGGLQINIVTADREHPFILEQFEVGEPWILPIPGIGNRRGLNLHTPSVEVFFMGNLARMPNIVCVVLLTYGLGKVFKFNTKVWICGEMDDPLHVPPRHFVPTREHSEDTLEDMALLAA